MLLFSLLLSLLPASACSLVTKLDAPSDGAPEALDACASASCSELDAAPPDYGAKYVAQSFPFATTTMHMTAGEVLPSYIELENVGLTPWDSATQLGTTLPRNRASGFADGTWLSPDRASAVSAGETIAPGKTFKFTFDLRAPETPGTYDEHFGLVNGSVWFGDVGQGGPPDDDIEVFIAVSPRDGGHD